MVALGARRRPTLALGWGAGIACGQLASRAPGLSCRTGRLAAPVSLEKAHRLRWGHFLLGEDQERAEGSWRVSRRRPPTLPRVCELNWLVPSGRVPGHGSLVPLCRAGGCAERAAWREARDPACAATAPQLCKHQSREGVGLGSCFDFSAKNTTIKPLRPFISLF